MRAPGSGSWPTLILVAWVGNKCCAHINPTVTQTCVVQVLRYDCCRDKLSESYDCVVPQLGILRAINGLVHNLTKFGKERIDLLQLNWLTPQVVDNLSVICHNLINLLVSHNLIRLLHSCENALQSVGCLTHRRHDDKQILLSLNNMRQVSYACGISN